MRFEQVMHLLRETMHFVQEQKSLRFKIVQCDQRLFCQRISFWYKRKQWLTAYRFASQSRSLLASGRQGDVQLSGFDAATDALGYVLYDLQRHVRIMLMECHDQLREHIRRNRRNCADRQLPRNVGFELVHTTL